MSICFLTAYAGLDTASYDTGAFANRDSKSSALPYKRTIFRRSKASRARVLFEDMEIKKN